MAAVKGCINQGCDHDHEGRDYGNGYHPDASEHANSMQIAWQGRLRSAPEKQRGSHGGPGQSRTTDNGL